MRGKDKRRVMNPDLDFPSPALALAEIPRHSPQICLWLVARHPGKLDLEIVQVPIAFFHTSPPPRRRLSARSAADLLPAVCILPAARIIFAAAPDSTHRRVLLIFGADLLPAAVGLSSEGRENFEGSGREFRG